MGKTRDLRTREAATGRQEEPSCASRAEVTIFTLPSWDAGFVTVSTNPQDLLFLLNLNFNKSKTEER